MFGFFSPAVWLTSLFLLLSLRDMDRGAETGFGKRFFIHFTGKTNGTHLGITNRLNDIGHFEVATLEESDYLLAFCPLFCPTASQLGENIREALEGLPGGRPIILVVMFPVLRDMTLLIRTRQKLAIPNVSLCVDCVVFNGQLLNCSINNMAWFNIMKYLGVPYSRIWSIRSWYWDHWKLAAFIIFLVVLLFLALIVAIPVLLSSSPL